MDGSDSLEAALRQIISLKADVARLNARVEELQQEYRAAIDMLAASHANLVEKLVVLFKGNQ